MLPPLPISPPPRKTLRPAATPVLPPLSSVKLLDQLRERIRYMHYSPRTEEAYVYWCRYFIRWHGLRHRAEMGGADVERFLSYLAGERGLAPSSRLPVGTSKAAGAGKPAGQSWPAPALGRCGYSRRPCATPFSLD